MTFVLTKFEIHIIMKENQIKLCKKSIQRLTYLFGIIGMLLVVLFPIFLKAQSPQAIPYQAIARDANGNPLPNQPISLRITLIDSNINSIDYQETHSLSTNEGGVFTLNIGQGTPLLGNFSVILWPISGNEHVQVEMDVTGGTNYVLMGISKLNSVPFALHANTSGDNKWNANGNSIYNNNSGNVGIGTTAPGAKLDVNGMAFFRNNVGGFVSGGGTGVKISTENNQGNIFGFDYTNFTPIDLTLQGEGGNVGIGNHFPESTLHITKPNEATSLIIGGNSQAGQFTALRLQTSANQGGYSNIQSIKYSGFDFGDLILNRDGGNIGIGTSTPNAKLDIAGTIKIADGSQGAGKVLTSDTNGVASWQVPATMVETDPKVGSLSNNKIPRWNGTSLLDGSIMDNGHVGINTNTPQRTLDVYGDIAQGMWLDSLPSRRIGVMDATTHVAGMEIENTTLTGLYSQKVHFLSHHHSNGYGRRVTIDEDGKVGIGTQTPQAKLEIVGNIKIADGTESQGAILTSDANGKATWTASVGCVIRAETWTSPASGTGYSTGLGLSPIFMYSSGIFGDTRLINPNGAMYTIGTFPNQSGVFTAPAEGYYELSLKIISVASNARVLLLASLNGAAPIEIFDVFTGSNCANCSDISHTQIMYLNAGDKHRVLRSVNSVAINTMVMSYRKL
jgi:hypothetical protein